MGSRGWQHCHLSTVPSPPTVRHPTSPFSRVQSGGAQSGGGPSMGRPLAAHSHSRRASIRSMDTKQNESGRGHPCCIGLTPWGGGGTHGPKGGRIPGRESPEPFVARHSGEGGRWGPPKTMTQPVPAAIPRPEAAGWLECHVTVEIPHLGGGRRGALPKTGTHAAMGGVWECRMDLGVGCRWLLPYRAGVLWWWGPSCQVAPKQVAPKCLCLASE